MSNKNILQNHNEILTTNNTSIDELIASIENLPEAGAGTSEDLSVELTSQETLLNNQNISINDIKQALQGKAVSKEYSRVSYIKFTGEQIVDTGIICNQNTKIKVVFTREKSSQHYILGVASSNSKASVTMFCGGNWRFGDKATSKIPITNEEMIYSGILDKSQITITSSKTAISDVNDFIAVGSLLLGSCRNSDGTTGIPQYTGKIYSLEIWQDGQLVVQLLPVINKEGKYGFLNTVSNFFLTSITETLLEGGEVEYEQ